MNEKHNLDPRIVDNLDPRHFVPFQDYLPPNYSPAAQNPAPTSTPGYSSGLPRFNEEGKQQRQAIVLSIAAVGALAIGALLFTAYMPGDRGEIAKLKRELAEETARANQLDATVTEQNKLLERYSVRLDETQRSLADAQTDIKIYREESQKLLDKHFSEYGAAPHE